MLVTFYHFHKISDTNNVREKDFIIAIVVMVSVHRGKEVFMEQNSSHQGVQEAKRGLHMMASSSFSLLFFLLVFKVKARFSQLVSTPRGVLD